jgi:hypothetical protein
MKKKVVAFFFLNKSIAARANFFPQDVHGFSTSQNSGYFLAEFFVLIQIICWMPQTDLFWLKKVQKNRFLVKFPKSGKTQTKKILFFFT